MRKTVIGAVLAGVLAGAGAAAGQEMETPPDWRWRLDAPARLVTEQEVGDSAWRFVMMPPGWHVTTGPGVLLYDPAERATGRYSLAADFVLFPNPSESGFGLFLCGTRLEGDTASYVAVLLRHDGAVSIMARDGDRETTLAPWSVHEAVKPYPGSGVVTNRLRVSVLADSVAVFVNDTAVTGAALGGRRTDGRFGFRIGGGINMHLTILDYTRHLAPARSR
jgi:hypothetical protein